MLCSKNISILEDANAGQQAANQTRSHSEQQTN